MAEFSAADAALTGFRIVWQRPRAVAWWAALQFVVTLALTAFVTVSAGPAQARLSAIGLQPPADPTQMLALFAQLAPTIVVLLAFSLVFYAVLYAAMNRAVRRPQEDRFGYLKLSSDELRQLGLFALMAAAGFVLYWIVAFAALLIVVVVGLASGGAPSAGEAMLLLILIPAVICVFVFFGVRFSLASPQTFATQRINLLGSWGLTRGRFWPLLGTYLIAFGLNLVVVLLTLAIAFALAAIAGGGFGALTGVTQTDPTSLAGVFTPVRLVYTAVTAIGTALSWPVTMTPPAAIYRAIAGESPAATSRMFD